MTFKLLIPLLLIAPLYSMSPTTLKPSTQLLTMLCILREQLPLPLSAKIFAYKTLLECYEQSSYENSPYIQGGIDLCKKLIGKNVELVPLIQRMEGLPEEKKQEVAEINAGIKDAKLEIYKNKILNNPHQFLLSNYTEEDNVDDFFRFDLYDGNATLLQKAAEKLSLKLVRILLTHGACPNTGNPVPLTIALKESFWMCRRINSQDIVQIITLLGAKTNWKLVNRSILNQAFSPNQPLSTEVRCSILQQAPIYVLKELYEEEKYRNLRYLERESKNNPYWCKPMLDAFLARKKLMYPQADAKRAHNYAIKREVIVNLPSLSSHISPTFVSQE